MSLHLLSSALLLLILLLNLAGLAVMARRLTGEYTLARVASPVLLSLLVFFVEHFVGLGRLSWVWPITTAAAAWIVWQERSVLLANRWTEAVFHGSFAYALMWRFLFPNIDGSSEKLTGLGFIRNYSEGTVLPAVDGWLPPFQADFYYSFQHYAASLAGRVFDWDIGFTYNVTVALIAALATTAGAGAAYLLTAKRTPSLVAAAALLLGGNGASPIVSQIKEAPALHTSMRLIGGSLTPGEANKPLGRWLVKANEVPEKEAVELPAESFSYLVSLGDHHPPLSGFVLLALALLAIAAVESTAATAAAYGVMAATLPLTAVANAWTLPLQAVLIGAWLAYRLVTGRIVLWLPFLGGLAISGILVSPFLRNFALRALDYRTAFRWVPEAEHTPIMLGLILFSPFLLILVAHLLSGQRKSVWLLSVWVLLLAVSELIYVDDVYSGKFDRFNTTLKWWPWIMTGISISVGVINLTAKSRLCRFLTWAGFAIMLSYSAGLAWHLAATSKPAAGRLSGDAWIASDAIEKPLLEFLKTQPRSVVLQRIDAGAFTYAPGLIMFAGHRAFLGWPEHEKLWRGRRADIDTRDAEVKAFYLGELRDARQWLMANSIEHVLWLKGDNFRAGGAFERLREELAESYFWREYYAVGDFRVGLWSRKR